jgi:hypothetical protein
MHGRQPKHPLPRSLNGLVLSQANVRRTKAGVSVEELVEAWGAAGHAGRSVAPWRFVVRFATKLPWVSGVRAVR